MRVMVSVGGTSTLSQYVSEVTGVICLHTMKYRKNGLRIHPILREAYDPA